MGVLVVCLAGISLLSSQIRCIDAAREAARLAARGDEPAALAAARRVAPTGAQIGLHRDGDFIVATVVVPATPLLPMHVDATGVAAIEPRR